MTAWQSETPIKKEQKKPYCTLLEAFKHSGPRTIIKRCFFDLLFSLSLSLSLFLSLSLRLQYKQDYTNGGSDALRGTISNLPAAHSWALSHLKVLGEICASIYSFRENVRNNCPKMRKSSSLLRFIGGVAVSSQGFFFFSPRNWTALQWLSLAVHVLWSLNLRRVSFILKSSRWFLTHVKVNYSPAYESTWSRCSVSHATLEEYQPFRIAGKVSDRSTQRAS